MAVGQRPDRVCTLGTLAAVPVSRKQRRTARTVLTRACCSPKVATQPLNALLGDVGEAALLHIEIATPLPDQERIEAQHCPFTCVSATHPAL